MSGITVKLKKAAVAAAAVGAIAAVLLFSNDLRQGVKVGLSLCVQTVIPSLFLFTAAALFITRSGIALSFGRLISPITRFLFGLKGEKATVMLMSAVAGYPVGAKLVDSLYTEGRISHADALKMLTFCVNAGPAFIVTAVGESVLGSRNDGWRLLAAHLAATCIIAAAVRFIPDCVFSRQDRKGSSDEKSQNSTAISDIFVTSVAEAGSTMLNVCFFVVFFAGVSGGMSAFGAKWATYTGKFLEVTNGISDCTRGQLTIVAFLLGFGGLSVMFQVLSAAKNCRLPFWLLLCSRLLHGALSAGIIAIAEIIFPRTLETGSFNTGATTAAMGSDPAGAIALMLLCAVLLVFVQRSLNERQSAHTVPTLKKLKKQKTAVNAFGTADEIRFNEK